MDGQIVLQHSCGRVMPVSFVEQCNPMPCIDENIFCHQRSSSPGPNSPYPCHGDAFRLPMMNRPLLEPSPFVHTMYTRSVFENSTFDSSSVLMKSGTDSFSAISTLK